jgi:hypothetical protein
LTIGFSTLLLQHAAEKLFSKSVILSVAKDLLLAHAESSTTALTLGRIMLLF